MTIKKLMMAAGAIDEPQVIALSSNDWDTSLGIFNFSGNTLGDHTIGGNVHAYQAKENFSSLITLDGDFVISFTMEDSDEMTFGVYGIESDSDRTNTDHSGMYYFSAANTAFWWGIGYASGASARINGGADGSFTAPANGSAMIIRRVSGTITLEDDGAVLHTYSVTYSNPMRFAGGSDTNGLDASLKDLFITDTDKVQRDGQFDEGGSNSSYGDSISNRKHSSTLFTATRTGKVTGLKVQVAAVSTAFSTHAELWTHDGTNPAAQVGSDSDSITLSSTGVKNFAFTDPTVVKGRQYWMVMVDESTGGSVAMLDYTAHPQGMGAGRHDTITSISDDWSEGMKMEITVDTSDGEPTPDHDTKLLIHSDTSDASTTFVDSSQSSKTITLVADTQHDTAQKKFGSSSILFDGSGDYLTLADSDDWHFGLGNFTVEMWIKTTTGNKGILEHSGYTGSSGNFSIFNIGIHISSNHIYAQVCSGGSRYAMTSSSNVADGNWNHIAVVRLANKCRTYINGSVEGNVNVSGSLNNVSGVLRIGDAPYNGTAYKFNGHMDEIRISKVARWGANFTPPSAPYP